MQKTFPRSIDALGDIYAFTEHAMTDAGIGDAVRFPVHLAMEELFTNMVKHCPGNANDIQLDIDAREGGVAVTLIDFDVDEFDVTTERNVDTSMPLDGRVPGGLGLHLVQRMVDSLEYEYSDRQSTVRFTKESG
jgi:serine/threonine-protein kinase RsbW